MGELELFIQNQQTDKNGTLSFSLKINLFVFNQGGILKRVQTLKAWLKRHFIRLDYSWGLPFAARMPHRLGRAMARLRGQLYGVRHRDWREFSFDDRVYERTLRALAELCPHANSKEVEDLQIKRYQAQSLEEYEAACLSAGVTSTWPVNYEGLEGVQKVLAEHGRVVLLTSHFSSSILGTSFLKPLGVPVLGMSSSAVHDPRVHPAISDFYTRKYQAFEPHLNGGSILHREGNTQRFVQFLKRGGALVIVGDLPPEPSEDGLTKAFLGKDRQFAAGAQRLADLFRIPLLAFVCESPEITQDGTHRVRFSGPNEDPYGFIARAIAQNPSQWWAMDLLPVYPRVEASSESKDA